MFSPSSSFKTLQHSQIFNMKSNSLKIKTLIHTLVVSHMCRIVRVLAKAKSIIFEIVKEMQLARGGATRKYKNSKVFLGSFRLHYNWCSSHVLPVPAPGVDYYDSTWNSMVSGGGGGGRKYEDDSRNLSGYLHWLEEKTVGNDDEVVQAEKVNEIDKLADLFIANCHEKFMLEKQESYRKFQEMLARSL